MDVQGLSSCYMVRALAPEDVEAVYALCAGNPLFYQYCPPAVTREVILEDMKALPPGKTLEDKRFVGFFESEKLVAVMDLILGYPDASTAFIGLFMLDKGMQGRGVGSAIMEDCAAYLRRLGYLRIRLGFAKGNPQSEAFWKKNGFRKTGAEYAQEMYTVVAMQREL